VGDLLAVTDFFVLVTASNARQLGTVAEEVEGRLKMSDGRRPRRREGTVDAGWIVLDYGDVVVHAFDAERRAFYSLERLWADAPRVEFVEPAVAVPASSSRPIGT